MIYTLDNVNTLSEGASLGEVRTILSQPCKNRPSLNKQSREELNVSFFIQPLLEQHLPSGFKFVKTWGKNIEKNVINDFWLWAQHLLLSGFRVLEQKESFVFRAATFFNAIKFCLTLSQPFMKNYNFMFIFLHTLTLSLCTARLWGALLTFFMFRVQLNKLLAH